MLELVVLLVSQRQQPLSLSCVVVVVTVSGDGQLIAAATVADDNNSLTLWSWPSCWLCINGHRGRGRSGRAVDIAIGVGAVWDLLI